jgi:aminoglycoside phosphotransferase (APT) family kinase protein
VCAHEADLVTACAALPRTLIHGDFVAKNLRVREDGARRTLVVVDWETAGWGLPGVDLAAELEGGHPVPDLHAYAEVMQHTWPKVSRSDFEELYRIGSLLRLLAAIDWEAASLGQLSGEGTLRNLALYASTLTAWLRTAGWVPG